jgi:hypothetical protein
MTNERTQAYGRVVQALEALEPEKLLPAEMSRIREAADTLIFAAGVEECREVLLDMSNLAKVLVKSGRWDEAELTELMVDLVNCGPELAEVSAAA